MYLDSHEQEKKIGETAHVSWWPMYNIWATEQGHGDIWTADDEKWYIHQKYLIKTHRYNPLAGKEWSKKLQQDRKTKQFWNRVYATCDAHLKQFGLEWSTMVNNSA